jgi:hypothetical protein
MRCPHLLVFVFAIGCQPVQVPASALEVHLHLDRSAVSQSADSAVLIQVRATNPRLRPVIVDLGDFRLTGDPTTGSGQGLGYHIEADSGDGGGGSTSWGKRTYRFGARRTIHQTFVAPLRRSDEEGLPSITRLPPGDYRVRGSFGTHTTPPVPLVVHP